MNSKTIGFIAGLIGFIASCIAIFAFTTGWQSIWDIQNGPSIPVKTKTRPVPTEIVKEPSPIVTDNIPTVPSQIEGEWNFSGLPGETVSLIATGEDHIVYAGTSSRRHGIFKSSDDGKSWSAINNGLGELDVTRWAIAPENPKIVVAATQNYTWMTKDEGKSWFPIRPTGRDEKLAVGFGSGDGERIFATLLFDSTYVSNDGGKSWDKIADSGNCSYMYPVPSTDIIYCILYGMLGLPDLDVYRSDDNGRTWWKAAGVGPSDDAITLGINSTDPSTVYVGTRANGIYRSDDGGGYWIPINNALPNQGNDLYINSILVDPTSPQTVYVAIKKHGVYKSSDRGDSWHEMTTGFPSDTDVLAIGLSQDSPRYLFAGTDGQGIFRYKLP